MGLGPEKTSQGSVVEAAHMANVQPLIEAPQRLVDGQQQAGFSRHIKAPDAFKAETRSEELQKWQDWKFAFENFIGMIDSQLLKDMKNVEKTATEIKMSSLNEEVKPRSEKLYSMLSMLMKNRPLRLVRGVQEQNGFEAWRVLMKDMQPSTRQRSLALVQALNKVKFDSSKSVTEQLPQFETMVREYERVSQTTYHEDLKVAAILTALPSALRTSLQMVISDSTTYEDIKSKIELYEQVTTQWSSESALQMPLKSSMDDEPTPMEVDAVWAKERKAKAKMARTLGFPKVSGLQKEAKTAKASQRVMEERKVERERV